MSAANNNNFEFKSQFRWRCRAIWYLSEYNFSILFEYKLYFSYWTLIEESLWIEMRISYDPTSIISLEWRSYNFSTISGNQIQVEIHRLLQSWPLLNFLKQKKSNPFKSKPRNKNSIAKHRLAKIFENAKLSLNYRLSWSKWWIDVWNVLFILQIISCRLFYFCQDCLVELVQLGWACVDYLR